MKNYVVGFAFNHPGNCVILIKKIRPEWQKGKWNGVGGSIEENESPYMAMVREFEEETGLLVPSKLWNNFLIHHFYDCVVYFFKTRMTFDELIKAKTITDEEIFIFKIKDIWSIDIIPNLRWVIPLALDSFVKFTYTKQ